MFFEDLARLSEKAGEGREAEIYLECAEMANKVDLCLLKTSSHCVDGN